MCKQQYIHKLESMIEDGLSDGKYQPTSDNTLQDLKSFQDFLYRNIRPLKSEVLPYDKIRPTSSQPGYLYATAKTHKFSNHKDITADKIKLRPIVSACGTFYYETAKSLASDLSPLTTNEHTINNTLDFADLLKDKTLEQDEIMVSYDVNSLFTEIPLDETIDYVIDQIYNEGKLAPLMSKTIFKRQLERVTKGSVFSFNNKLYKRNDGCGMGNPLSPVLANIFMCKLEEHIIPKHSPAFYHGYVDDCLSKRKKNSPDHLLQSFNAYHPNITFTVEENPTHFLDTAFQFKDHSFSTSTYVKPGKLPAHWKSATPVKWKRNTLWGALHRAKRLTTNWEQDLQSVKKRFQHAGYPFNFIQKTIHEFENPKESDTIIPVNWLDDRRTVTIRVPYCEANEQQSYAFIKKLERFTRGHYKFAIIWQTKKLTSMFRLKDNNIHPSHVVYHGTCADCSAPYIRESCRNFETRKQEHEDATKQSEPARHLRENPYHHFNWRVIAIAHPLGIRRILESMFIAKFQPCLNKQVHSYTLNLFPKGIT